MGRRVAAQLMFDFGFWMMDVGALRCNVFSNDTRRIPNDQ